MSAQKFFVGKNAVRGFQEELRAIAPERAFLIRGRQSYSDCGAGAVLNEILSNQQIKYYEWYDFSANPKIEDVQKGLQLLMEANADVIIAVGGGSVLDMAKLVRFAYSYSGNLLGRKHAKEHALIPIFALPTTAGTGCEATPFAVCYEGKTKYSVAHEDMLPDYAVVYPPFSYRNPNYLTACCGFDALAQAIEAYWNVNATTESDEYAKKAIEAIWYNLPFAVNNPNDALRDILSEAAYWAGKAIAITKTTAPHAFSYAFTSYCNYPHGHAVALTFPFWASENLRNISKIKTDYLLSVMGADLSNVRLALENYITKIGLQKRGFEGYDVEELLHKVNADRMSNNPVRLSDCLIDELRDYLLM